MLNVNKRQSTESSILEMLECLDYIRAEQLFKIGCSYCYA